MLMLIYLITSAMILAMMVLAAGEALSFKSNLDREALSVFECGFSTKLEGRSPFSLHFFLVSLIFLIFDVELILLFPILLTLQFSQVVNIMMFFMLITVLTLGLAQEWNQKMLEWAY